jgi:hypothetical protein
MEVGTVTEEEFRADLLVAAASRAEVHATGSREALVEEMLDRLREAGELPDAETCAESIVGQRGRKLEIDAFAFDEADDSLHLFAAIQHDGSNRPPVIALSEAREQGFNRLLGVFEQAREGWLTKNIEESRPLWSLARRIHTGGKPAALRLNVLTDRVISERVREIPQAATREGIPVSFQIWDLSRLKRIHDAGSIRDDLFVDLSSLPGGGLSALPATANDQDYTAYLLAVPGDALAEIYLRYGSRLLEGNVRTFLGRRGNINRGIASTLAKEPRRFFAYNNGIAATASQVSKIEQVGGSLLITGITDLQIVNGAQTTASLAAIKREGKLPTDVAVPMKLSVVRPEIATELIPLISRYANSQNSVRASDFFANHAFHRRMEEISRRIFAPAVGSSQVQTHWYYERARGQYLNDQAGLTGSKRDQFARVNPRHQVVTKTDLAKVENCFDLLPDIACRGAEKSFTAFAEKITADWKDEKKRALLTDDWYRGAVARVILFRATEVIVSNAAWYEGGYRAQIVAYTTARLVQLANDKSAGGRLDYMKVWSSQAASQILEQQLAAIASRMAEILLNPPQAGQNISEWAKQQACRRRALEAEVDVVNGLGSLLVDKGQVRDEQKSAGAAQDIADDLEAQTAVVQLGPVFWSALRAYGQSRKLFTTEDVSALSAACSIPRRIPEGWQAKRLLALRERCQTAGFED